MKTHKIDVDDLAGSFYISILASSKYKRLEVKTYIHETTSEVVYTVTVNKGRESENKTSYLALKDAVDIYNLAE